MKLNKRLTIVIAGSVCGVTAVAVSTLSVLALTGLITHGLTGIYGLSVVLLACAGVIASIMEDKL